MISNWREALNRQGPQDRTRDDYTEAIGGYLDYCRLNHQTVAVASARNFVADIARRGQITGERLSSWKAGLNWFFKKDRTALAPMPQGAPSLGRADLGRADWERRLIERIRLLHYSWRTEQTYREWAWRLAGFMGKRELESVTGDDIKGFLSELAVKYRVSVATQKQALNALVFLVREALCRDPGDLSITGHLTARSDYRASKSPMILMFSPEAPLFQSMFAMGLRVEYRKRPAYVRFLTGLRLQHPERPLLFSSSRFNVRCSVGRGL